MIASNRRIPYKFRLIYPPQNGASKHAAGIAGGPALGKKNSRVAVVAPAPQPKNGTNGKNILKPAPKKDEQGTPLNTPWPILKDSQFVPANIHKTPTSIMKFNLPKRIRALIKLHG